MMPILYDANETAYTHNGFGILNNATRCTVTREINGLYDLEMDYPLRGIHAEDIQERRIIRAWPDPYSDPQPFRIVRIKKTQTSGKMTVWAQHVAFDTEGIPVGTFTGTNARNSVTAMRQAILTDADYQVSTTMSSTVQMVQKTPKSMLRSIIGSEGSFVDTYGGEVEMDGMEIRIVPRLGTVTDVRIMHGRNLTSLDEEIATDKLYSAVAPYWHDDETGLTIQPLGYVVPIPGVSGLERVLTLDLSDKFDTRPTPDQVKTAAEKYIAENGIGELSVSMDIDFYQLDSAPGYDWMREVERVQLGDTVTVILAEGVRAQSRVTKTNFDALRGVYNSVAVGTIKKDLAAELARLIGGM